MNKLLKTLILVAGIAAMPALAQQAQEYGNYTIHYNAFNSSMLAPEVAKAYGIRRSDSRALINISVLKGAEGQSKSAIKAEVTASGRNLTGQTRTIDMREIDDGDGAVYYIGEMSVSNMETFDFTVLVRVDGQNEPFSVHFRQQFYTE